MKKILLVLVLLLTLVEQCFTQSLIDRYKLVSRHNITISRIDSLESLSVGNGEFAFTVDATGLQTFYEKYEKGVPLGTQSNWGWHSFPNTEKYNPEESYQYFEVSGSKVPYRHMVTTTPRSTAACTYFRENPHRLHLGLIGLVLIHENGKVAIPDDITDINCRLDLWTGTVTSSFKFENQPVTVELFCSQKDDQVLARVKSSLVKKGRLWVRWRFPSAVNTQFHSGIDFTKPGSHTSVLYPVSSSEVLISRKIDDSEYEVDIRWEGIATIAESAQHQFDLKAAKGDEIIFGSLFAPKNKNNGVAGFDELKEYNLLKWKEFWESGGVVDFSECTDSRANELERRVVLSQYLTKIQGSGSLPPQETGLTCNSWFGKFHLEMHWWHIAHFANWGRPQLMEKQVDYYNQLYDKALFTAEEQGYNGVRWQKMVGPDGENSPSSVGSYLIWQQPHVIWFAEQIYLSNPVAATLEKYKKLVFSTADFMADFAVWNKDKRQYELCPPLIPAQEIWPRETTKNPPYELAYWYWGLSAAQEWGQRLGLEKNKKWEDVRLNLAKPQVYDGFYPGIENAFDSYTNHSLMRDHPSVLAAYGILPSWDKINPEAMRKTLKLIAERWNWQATWGWDYPMAAMCAVRLEEPELALDLLLKEVQKNTFLKNGHNYQDNRLTIYLPGNGGLLTAVAMMCAGFDGNKNPNPGFPKNGKWNVKWEKITPVF